MKLKLYFVVENPNTLFRGNSLTSKSVDQFMKVSTKKKRDTVSTKMTGINASLRGIIRAAPPPPELIRCSWGNSRLAITGNRLLPQLLSPNRKRSFEHHSAMLACAWHTWRTHSCVINRRLARRAPARSLAPRRGVCFQIVGVPYLIETLGPILQTICYEQRLVEIDPYRIKLMQRWFFILVYASYVHICCTLLSLPHEAYIIM